MAINHFCFCYLCEMSLVQFLTLCCAILMLSVNAKESLNDPIAPNNIVIKENINLGKRNPMAIAGLVVSVVSTIISLVTSTIGLAKPSETDMRLDTVIATLDKIESHLANLDSTLMDVFDVQAVKQLSDRIVAMKDKFLIYLQNPDDTDARKEYVRSCKKNEPQLGSQLFGGKKLSDFCLAYRSKDLYFYAVSPYLTARRLVLYAQEAAIKEALCMIAKNQSNTYINASATLMLTRIKELNQSLDTALRMEETLVRYVIRQPPECFGAQTSLDRLDVHYTVFYKCDPDKLEEAFKWQFDFVEMVATSTSISHVAIHKTKPSYCTKELRTTRQGPKYCDVKDVPRFAAGYAQFSDMSAFRMRSLYRNETMIATIRSMAGPGARQCHFDGGGFCGGSCDRVCNFFQQERDKNNFDPLFQVFKIIRNPRESSGASTFNFMAYGIAKNVLSWLGHPCYCTFFIDDNSDHRKWLMFGMDSAGKITPLI